ncbi:hypothetical protein DYB37_010945 [Aphanomyces astaci]|uniref:C2H2-type domain-containing protein n=1 Tax=Aphanomyces astaci TaxID=112090 RepID=A0A418E0M5_APHAT|nr:hypothetical protein DYB37_010945 [Aphanomyces astaci]
MKADKQPDPYAWWKGTKYKGNDYAKFLTDELATEHGGQYKPSSGKCVRFHLSHLKTPYSLGQRAGTAGDFELLFAIDVFKAHITSLCASGRPPQRGVPLTVTTVSTYELVRTRSYPSSHSLGQHLSTVLMEDVALREFVADIRVNGKGMLTFTSHEHMTWHAVRGRLPCSQCGRFFNGPKGIRVHQMLNHNISFANIYLRLLCTKGSVDMLKFLHCQQLDFALINRNGHSALHKAAIKGHLEACRWLLDVAGLGWNHMQKDEDGFTPQRFAMENGHVELGAYLAQAEASLRTITA